jgi:hypothetical protein
MDHINRTTRAGTLPASRRSSSRSVGTGSGGAPVQPSRITTTARSMLKTSKIRFPWTFRKKRRVTIMNTSFRNDSRQPNDCLQLPINSIPERNDMCTMISMDTSVAESTSDSRMMSCRSNFTNVSIHGVPDTTITFARPNPFPRQPVAMYYNYVAPPNAFQGFQIISESSEMDRPSTWNMRLAVIHLLIALGILLLTAASSFIIPTTLEIHKPHSIPLHPPNSHFSMTVNKESQTCMHTNATEMKHAQYSIPRNDIAISPSVESTVATIFVAAVQIWRHTAPLVAVNKMPTNLWHDSVIEQRCGEAKYQSEKVSEEMKGMLDSLPTLQQQHEKETFIIPSSDNMEEYNESPDSSNHDGHQQHHKNGTMKSSSFSQRTSGRPDLQAWMPFCNASMLFALLISIAAAWTAPHDDSYRSANLPNDVTLANNRVEEKK